MSKKKYPKLSVLVLAYNHENFIKECLNSIYSQKVDFEYEIVIGDDASKDNTVEKIKENILDFNISVNLLTAENNLGLIKNYIRCLKACKGEFIAILSGDDYWIDPFKIQRQVEFLEKNPEYGFTYTNYNSFNQENGQFIINYLKFIKHKPISGFCRDELISGNPCIMNITCCFRKQVFSESFFGFIDDELIKAEDFPTFMWAGFDFKIYFHDEITTVYRVNKNSITNSQNLDQKWEFLLSHVYIREKFLKCKKYYPKNWPIIQASTNRAILEFCLKSYSGKNHSEKALLFLKNNHFFVWSDWFYYLGLKNRFLNKLSKLILKVLKKN